MMRSKASELPLKGVKVVDFGQYIAGPAVGMMLADLGATVVHIDPPSGPFWDNPANATAFGLWGDAGGFIGCDGITGA